MTQSSKLGVTSAVLLASVFVPPFSNWREPISFASAGLSFVLGLIAALQGSKWWLAIPCSIIAGCAAFWYLAAHSF
jgi:hypothetical protein